MKFQKTAIAVTIAGFAAMPMMASADTVLSGVIQVKYQGTDADDDEPDMAAGDIRVAIASEHELNGGLIGYGNVQLNVDDLTGEGGLVGSGLDVQADTPDADGSLTDEDIVELTSSATVASDNVYVGVKGGFGDLRFGEIPLAVEYGQLANDIHDVGVTVPGGASYTGVFGPVGLGVNYSLEEDSDMVGVGAKFNLAGATIGLGFEDRGDGARYAAGASYAIAGFSLAAHFWAGEVDFNPDLVIDTEDPNDDNFQANDFDINDTQSFAVQVGYSIAGVSLGLTYSYIDSDEQQEQEDGVPIANADQLILANEESVIRFDIGYDLGGDTALSARVQNTSTDIDNPLDPDADEDDLLEYRVMLSKTF